MFENNLVQLLLTQPSTIILRQVIAFGVALITAWIFQFLARRGLDQVEKNYAELSWTRNLIIIAHQVLWPLLARGFIELAKTQFEELNWSHILLDWSAIFINLWLLYRLSIAVLTIFLTDEQVAIWNQKIILPLIFIVGLLQGLGLMDNILQWSLIPRDDINLTLGSVLVGLATVIIFFFLSSGLRQYLERNFFPQLNIGMTLTQVLSTVIGIGVIAIGTMIALVTMGVNLTSLAVVLGGLSVGLGFGLQEIVSNSVSGFILLFERSVQPGNVVRVGGSLGVVQRVSLRSTIIRTQDNIELVVPNSQFLNETVTNLTRTEARVRIRISVGVSYDSDPRQVEKVLLEAAEHPKVLDFPKPTVQFMEFGDSSLNFDLLIWTIDAARIIPLASDLRYKIWDGLKAHNIEIPFPQRDLHFRSGVPERIFSESTSNGSG